MMGSFVRFLSFIVVIVLVFNSCTQQQRSRLAVTPNSYGKVDNIMVVADPYTWETTIGDTLRTTFEALFPVTPQPETLYDLRYKSPKEFKEGKIYKTFRSILILGVLDDENDGAALLIRKALGEAKIQKAYDNSNYTIAIQRNRWADGQTIIYWFAPSRTALLETVAQNYEQVIQQFNKADTDRLIESTYAQGQNTDATNLLYRQFDLSLKIPREFVIANTDTVSLWMRHETNKTSSNIFVYSLPLADTTDPTPTHHKYIRDQLTRRYFSSRIENSYMRIDDRYMPIYYQNITFDGQPTLQARGLWGMVNDFMGGSFISYMIKDEAHDRVLLLDGFVHAPGQKKRPLLRQLDVIFSTLSIQNTPQE